MPRSRQNHDPITDKQRVEFLEQLAGGASVVKAAEAADAGRRSLYRLRHSDPAFAVDWINAYDEGTDVLEAEAQRRGQDGVVDFKLDREGVEHPTRVYSDQLLMFLLRARRPARFRENYTVEHQGPAGGPIILEQRKVVSLADVVDFAESLELDGDRGPASS